MIHHKSNTKETGQPANVCVDISKAGRSGRVRCDGVMCEHLGMMVRCVNTWA